MWMIVVRRRCTQICILIDFIFDFVLLQHRFSHLNAEDSQMVQNLLDWYLYSEAKSAKPIHRAKIIAS